MPDDDNVVQFAAARADLTGDCRDWTPLLALRTALAKVESGELKPTLVYVAMAIDGDTPNTMRHTYQAAGGTKLELMGLLARHIQVIGEN